MFTNARRLLVSCLIFLAFAAPQAFAQEAAGNATTAAEAPAPAWNLNCASANAGDAALQCRITQTLVRQDTNQLLMMVTINKQPQSGALAMSLVLPHGLYLPAGVSYRIDSGAENTTAIFSSDQNGAYANIPLNTQMLNALKSGTVLNIGLETAARSPLDVPVSLIGFTAAVDKLASIE